MLINFLTLPLHVVTYLNFVLYPDFKADTSSERESGYIETFTSNSLGGKYFLTLKANKGNM